MSVDEPADLPARFSGGHSRPLWRSLDELAGEDSFREYLEHEFPSQAVQWLDSSSRRRFLRMMGA